MRLFIIAFLLLGLCTVKVFASNSTDTIFVSEDLILVKISEHAYIHESYHISEKWGRFSSNGLLVFDENKACLFDTPMVDSITTLLLNYIQNSMQLNIVAFVPNHWHIDAMGGLQLIHDMNIPSYAHEKTIEIANEKGLTVPKNGFADSLNLKIGNMDIKCTYHGASHSLDNIVVWLASSKILFAGCMVKEMNAKNLGFIGDGDLDAYPITLKQLLEIYRNAKYVVPGHGKYGGLELIEQTLEMAEKKAMK